MLDPVCTDLSAETSTQLDKRRYKITARGIYDVAAARAPSDRPGCEVLLWNEDGRLLETCTSNVALWMPRTACMDANGGKTDQEGVWVTPKLDPNLDQDMQEVSAVEAKGGRKGKAVFLDGVVRQELLYRGMIQEGEVTVQDFERCMAEGRSIIGFNGLR